MLTTEPTTPTDTPNKFKAADQEALRHVRENGHHHRLPDDDFHAYGLSPRLLRGIDAAGYERPSPVQREAIPALLRGRDVIAEAPSGSGKTAAFAVPSLEMVDATLNETQVLVLAPTRALSHQIHSVLTALARFMSPAPRVGLAASGEFLTFERGAYHVLVGTPSKVLDHGGLQVGSRRTRVDFGRLRLLVLDEADELLDRLESRDEIRHLVTSVLPQTAQVGLFSATMTASALETAANLVRDSDVVSTIRPEDCTQVRPAISHFHVCVGPARSANSWETRAAAIEDLNELFGAASNIVFVRTRQQQDFLVHHFKADTGTSEYTCDLERFRAGKARVLIATDALGRGIDCQAVAVVYNFDVPVNRGGGYETPSVERYLQRAGRAGRFGRTGVTITLCDDEDARAGGHLPRLERQTGLRIPALDERDFKSLPGFGKRREIENMAKPPLASNPPPAPAPAPAPLRDELSKALARVAELESKNSNLAAEVQELNAQVEELNATVEEKDEAIDLVAAQLEAEISLSEQMSQRSTASSTTTTTTTTSASDSIPSSTTSVSTPKCVSELDSSMMVRPTTTRENGHGPTGSDAGRSETSSSSSVLTLAPRRLGTEKLVSDRLVRGDRYVGKVVKLVDGVGAFVRFGDAACVCEKDGLVRNGVVENGLRKGQWVRCSVGRVWKKSNGQARIELHLV